MGLMNHVRTIRNSSTFYSSRFHFSTVSYGDDYSPDPTERYDSPSTKSKEQEFDKRVLINRTRPERCDKIITLYKLYRERNKEEKAPEQDLKAGCEGRPFIVVPIPSSNMILIVASTLCKENLQPFVNLPIEKTYNATSLQCFKLKNHPTQRRHLKHCFNRHENESQIEICGKASKFHVSFYMLSLATLVTIQNYISNFF